MFSTILAIAPLVVRAVESAFGGKSGSEKAAKAVEVIDAFLPSKTAGQADELARGISMLISALVLIYHATGRFRRGLPKSPAN